MMKNSSSSMVNAYNIPNDIIFDILLQLPIKIVLRCKSVCKSWYKIIDDPRLVFMHWKKMKIPPANNFLLECGIVFFSHPSVFMRYNFLPVLEQDITSVNNGIRTNSEEPKSWFSFSLDVVGSCNGLICLKVLEKEKFRIMNPLYSISHTYEVELPSQSALTNHVAGFGYDESSHIFKIVCLECECSYDVISLLVHELGGSGAPSWRILSQSVGLNSVISLCYKKASVFVDGCIHWFATLRNNGMNTCKSVVSFNLTTEALEIRPLPVEDFGSLFDYSDSLLDLDGSLCVVTRYAHDIGVWVLCEENNNKEITKKWILKFCIEWFCRLSGNVQLVGFFKAYHILMKTMEGQYFSYNTQSGIITPLPELANNTCLLKCHKASLIRPSNLTDFEI